MGRYEAPWNSNFNDSNALAHNTMVTVAFLDGDGSISRAKEIMLRFTAEALWDGKIHCRFYADASDSVPVSATDFFFRAEDTAREIRFHCGKIEILNVDASGGALAAALWIDAYSDEDLTGTTIT